MSYLLITNPVKKRKRISKRKKGQKVREMKQRNKTKTVQKRNLQKENKGMKTSLIRLFFAD